MQVNGLEGGRERPWKAAIGTTEVYVTQKKGIDLWGTMGERKENYFPSLKARDFYYLK